MRTDPICCQTPSEMCTKRHTQISLCNAAISHIQNSTKSHSNSFIPRTASLLNSLPGGCFPHPTIWTVLRGISIPASSSPELFSFKSFSSCSPLPRLAFSLVLGELALLFLWCQNHIQTCTKEN